MRSVRVFCLSIAFIHVLIAPPNDARAAERGNGPPHRGPLRKMTTEGPDTTMMTGPETTPPLTTPGATTSAETQTLPSSTNSTTSSTASTNTFPPAPTLAFSPPPITTTTARSTNAFLPPSSPTKKTTVTSTSGPNTLAAINPLTANTTTTTPYPAIFADAEPAYNDVYIPYNTNDPASANSQKVLVKQAPITLMKLVPLPMPSNGYSGTNQQGSQIQPYMVVDQSQGYRMDYYHLPPMVGNNYPSVGQQGSPSQIPPFMMPGQSPTAYPQGPDSQVELLEPYMMMNQAPSPYQQGVQFQEQPYLIVDQAPAAYQQQQPQPMIVDQAPAAYQQQPPPQPMIVDRAPALYQQGSQFQQQPYMMWNQAPPAYQQPPQPQQYQPYMVVNEVPANYYNGPPGSYPGAGQEFQQQQLPNMVMQPPYAEDIKMGVPTPAPHNLTLSKPDALIVKKDMGNNANNIAPQV